MNTNPLVILLYSILRHIVVTGMFALLALFSLPDSFRENVEASADWIAPVIGAFLVWLVMKYGAIILKRIGYMKVVILFIGLSIPFLQSCAITYEPESGRFLVVPDSKSIVIISEKGADFVNDQIDKHSSK